MGRRKADPDQCYSVMFTLRLTPHQERVLDAVVHEVALQTDNLRLNRQDLVRDLIRERYRAMVQAGMRPVDRG